MHDFSNSRSDCQKFDGDLAVFDVYEKYFHFREIYYEKLGLNQHMWFGLRDHHGDGPTVERRWITGSFLAYQKFLGEPPSSTGTSDDCYISSAFGDHLWIDDLCSQLRFFICEKACSYDLEYSNRYFTINQVNRTCDEGRNYCQSHGGDLAIINNSDLTDFLSGYLTWTQSVWIGLRDINSLDNFNAFVWVNGTVASSYTDWGVYSQDTKRDCVLIQKNNGKYNWINVDCNRTSWTLCEFGTRPVASTTAYRTTLSTNTGTNAEEGTESTETTDIFVQTQYFYIKSILVDAANSVQIDFKPILPPSTNDLLATTKMPATKPVITTVTYTTTLSIHAGNEIEEVELTTTTEIFAQKQYFYVKSILMDAANPVEKFWLQTNRDQTLCYNVPNVTYDFNDAQAHCQLYGGNLAILDAANKSDSLTGIYYGKLGLDKSLWIGLVNIQSKHANITQFWINGIKPTYTNFAYPPDGTIQDCYLMDANSTHKWFLELCSNQHHFLCQKGNKIHD
ncbi:uncharacterized protein TRIADDRAFT_56681 [Trichoplax adhaerens]|uniref:C-type lectin domain-containing protein n=1 Tax=Trichoplax adhaerens TaxID=10228 RepID=B3RWA7_TRIAD|nr:hypothetical protein TRIADDRAFT_56681 [Trichoplax adhaerens]EDV24660.1 hypothetical protein TRIADDRAFT_56681 [Trichoplax adhaerens]|eukprot:XP_002112550.1 hypothetical protein TRIADDRAFT_56681 [Trichoplax adhaerens]